MSKGVKEMKVLLLICLLFLSGCAGSLIRDLAKDPASACGYSTITYGAGVVVPSPAVPVGGVYVHQRFCRSNTPGSVVELKPDGTISVQHGIEKAVGPTIK